MKFHQDPTQKNREKLMRCRRCHEIVAARFVKTHICSQQYKCNICRASFVLEESYVKHLKSHNQTQVYSNSRIHKCSVCDKNFSSETQLINHLSEHGKLKSTYECNVKNKESKLDSTKMNALKKQVSIFYFLTFLLELL